MTTGGVRVENHLGADHFEHALRVELILELLLRQQLQWVHADLAFGARLNQQRFRIVTAQPSLLHQHLQRRWQIQQALWLRGVGFRRGDGFGHERHADRSWQEGRGFEIKGNGIARKP